MIAKRAEQRGCADHRKEQDSTMRKIGIHGISKMPSPDAGEKGTHLIEIAQRLLGQNRPRAFSGRVSASRWIAEARVEQRPTRKSRRARRASK